MTDHPYRDPILYDLEYDHLGEDIAFYTDLARRLPGPVTELGCGNGRILIPIARAGVTIHGIDSSAPMLADLARKLTQESPGVRQRATWHQGDFGSVAGPCALVLWPFNALHYVPGPEALVDTLRLVRNALRDDGVLALDCYLPDPALYAREPLLRPEVRTDLHPVTGEALRSWQEGWWDAAQRVHHVVYVWQHADGHQTRLHNPLQMYDLAELHALLARAGFRVHREAEDFSGSPVRSTSVTWVAELRPT